MEQPLIEQHVCVCKKETNWNKIILKTLLKLFFSAVVKVFVTKILVDALRK